jgi:hypothetical protein
VTVVTGEKVVEAHAVDVNVVDAVIKDDCESLEVEEPDDVADGEEEDVVEVDRVPLDEPDGVSDDDDEEVKDAVAEDEAVVLVENVSIELCVPEDENVPDKESRELAVFVTKGTVGVIDADTVFDTCEVEEIVTENETVALVDEKNKLVVEIRAL